MLYNCWMLQGLRDATHRGRQSKLISRFGVRASNLQNTADDLCREQELQAAQYVCPTGSTHVPACSIVAWFRRGVGD